MAGYSKFIAETPYALLTSATFTSFSTTSVAYTFDDGAMFTVFGNGFTVVDGAMTASTVTGFAHSLLNAQS